MNSNLRKILPLILCAILLFCCGLGGYQWYQKQKSDQVYERAKEVVSLEQPPPTPKVESEGDPYVELVQEIDLPALQAMNEDVIGWILIPDTPISYPLMYSGDNSYYLERTWDQQYNAGGSIFLEQYNAPDLSDFNTIVYGHRMRNDSMFGSLKYYNENSYWSEHPYVYIYNEMGAFRYEIFSAYEASVTGKTYRLELNDPEDRQSFLDACTGWSVIDTGVVPTVDDQILTLSTCTGKGYDTRWVVQAKYSPESNN